MISNRCARKYLVTNCNSIISKNYLRFLVDSNETLYQLKNPIRIKKLYVNYKLYINRKCLISAERSHTHLKSLYYRKISDKTEVY